MRKLAPIESIGCFSCIEGRNLTDREDDRLLSNLAIQSFDSRDQSEVDGYAELMDQMFNSWQEIPFNAPDDTSCCRHPCIGLR